MLSDADVDRGQVEHLTASDTNLRCAGEPRTAAAAVCGLVAERLIRVHDLLQSPAAMTALATRLAPGLPAQRLRIRLAQPIAGRRLGGVPRRRGHLPLQLSDTRVLANDVSFQRHHMSLQRDHQVGEFIIGWLWHNKVMSQ